MASSLIDIKDYLIALTKDEAEEIDQFSFGIEGNKIPIFIGNSSPEKINQLILIEDRGLEQTHGYSRETFVIHFIAHGHSFELSYNLANKVKLLLENINTITMNGYRYVGTWCLKDISHLGQIKNWLSAHSYVLKGIRDSVKPMGNKRTI